ncbi:metapyrocatechase, partial [Achromobacter insolitus]
MQSNAQTAPLAVHSVDEFVFSVPDIEEARRFYSNFGLDVRDEGEYLALYTHGHPQRWARIRQGDRKRLLWLSMGIHASDAERFAAHLDSQGIARIAAPPGADPGGLWIEAPDGLALQLRIARKSSPSAPAPQEPRQASGNAGRAPARSQVRQVKPLYLSHILLFSADVVGATRFYVDALGLRVSDISGDVIAFIHSPHGSDHHLIALAKSHGLGLHHSSWCVPSIDAVGLGMEQMGAAGYAEGWG